MKYLTLFFTTLLFAKSLYFMPYDGKSAQKSLFNTFSHAHKEIKIAMYVFTNKTLAKALKIAAKNGVKIKIVADKKEAFYKLSVIPNLAAIRNFQIHLLEPRRKGKMHIKLAIVDDKIVILGSANYTYSSFFKNFEIIETSKSRNKIKEFNQIFDKLWRVSKPY